MLPTPVSAGLGLLFILLGAAAVWLIFDASRRTHSAARRDRIIHAHRGVPLHRPVLPDGLAHALENREFD